MDEREGHIARLVTALERTYHHPGHLAWRGFLMGLASGAGATIGAAAILIIIGFLVRKLGGAPVIGDWFNNVQNALPKN